jgi:acyl carrier protein
MGRVETAIEILARLTGREGAEISPDMALVADLGIGSAAALQLLVELEDALEIEISDERAAGLETVGDILDYLQQAG